LRKISIGEKGDVVDVERKGANELVKDKAAEFIIDIIPDKETAIKENKKLRKLRQPIKETVDEDQIKVFWKIIVREGSNHKFHVFKRDGSVSKELDVDNVEELIDLCKKHNLEGLNCLSVNSFEKGKTKVSGVREITGILIDIDVKKERKINGVSTPDDKAIAKKTAEAVIKKLEEVINLRISLIADSGNGYHIYIPIFISLDGFFTGKTEDENKEKWDNSDIKGRLISLEKQLDEFSNDVVEIDCISKDIVRRVKIPGTWNVKKEISKKDYRMARIIETFDDVVDNFIDSNTTVFLSLEPYEEIIDEPVKGEDAHDDFANLLKRDKKVFDLFNGDWKKEPYSIKSDGAPKTKWTRSEAEHMLLCRLIWYDLPKEQIFSIMDKSKIGKWKDAPVAYKTHQYKSAINYIKKHGGTKTTSRRIAIKKGDRRIAILQIMGKNKFCINSNNGEVIFPQTETKTPWQTSIYYRKQITKSLMKSCKLIESEAEDIVNILCAKAIKKIRILEGKGAFSRGLDDEKQDILGDIKKVSVARSTDGNIYNLHLDGEIIKLKDTELYDGPHPFCVQYLNRFLKKIIISKEEWDENFIPYLLSEKMIETEKEKMESNFDVIYRKFSQHIRNKIVNNWADTEKRTAYKDAVYLDVETGILLICGDFIQDFFERFRIAITYRITIQEFNSFLRLDKGILIKERTQQRVGDNERKSFWRFDAGKLGITEENIAKEETLEQDTTDKDAPKIEDFERGDEDE